MTGPLYSLPVAEFAAVTASDAPAPLIMVSISPSMSSTGESSRARAGLAKASMAK